MNYQLHLNNVKTGTTESLVVDTYRLANICLRCFDNGYSESGTRKAMTMQADLIDGKSVTIGNVVLTLNLIQE